MRRPRLRIWVALAVMIIPLVLSLVLFLERGPRGPAPVRHEDPAAVAAEAEPAAVFETYLEAISRFTSWRFREGTKLVIHLDQANLPVEIKAIAGDLSNLVIEEGSILEAADGQLREAAALLEAGRLDDARPVLERLSAHVRRGASLFDDVAQGFQELARRSNVEALPPEASQRRAYQELQRVAVRAKALLLTYGALAKDPQAVAAVGRLLPYQTRIDLSVSSTAYPGRAFTVRGTVTEQAIAPSRGRMLTLLLDDQILAELPLGPFRRELVLPERAVPGAHLIAASVPTRGRYLGATARRSVRVTQAVPVLRVRWPKLVHAPGRLVLSGTAESEFGPVTQAVVQIVVSRTMSETRTSESGEFQFALDLPGHLTFAGPETFTLRLLPREPWHAPVELTLDLIIINLISAGLSAALVLPAAGIVYTRTRRRQVAAERPVPYPARRETGSTSAVQAPAGVPLPSTPRAELLATYLEVVRDVQGATGVRMTPSTTLREFTRQVQPKLRSATFAQMTGLAEVALYSSRAITWDSVEEIRGLKVRLEGELGSGVS